MFGETSVKAISFCFSTYREIQIFDNDEDYLSYPKGLANIYWYRD